MTRLNGIVGGGMLLMATWLPGFADAAPNMLTLIARCQAQFDDQLDDGHVPVVDCLKMEAEKQFAAISKKQSLRGNEFKRLLKEYDETFLAFFNVLMNEYEGCDCDDAGSAWVNQEFIPELHQLLNAMVEMRRSNVLCYYLF